MRVACGAGCDRVMGHEGACITEMRVPPLREAAPLPGTFEVFEAIADRRLDEINRLSHENGTLRGRLDVLRLMAERATQGSSLERQIAASLLVSELMKAGAQ